MERRLSAILAADVVGYSALMEQEEAGTFDRLRAHRKELFEPEIERHHGLIFKLTGDGLFAEFASVVDAVGCTFSLQRGLAERNWAGAEAPGVHIEMPFRPAIAAVHLQQFRMRSLIVTCLNLRGCGLRPLLVLLWSLSTSTNSGSRGSAWRSGEPRHWSGECRRLQSRYLAGHRHAPRQCR
jgi:hypothetical protein